MGLNDTIVGKFAGGPIVKGSELDPPDPVTTVMLATPVLEIKLAGTDARNWVALTNVVLNDPPFHCTVEALVKPLPFTVSVNAEPPAGVEGGLRLVISVAAAVELPRVMLSKAIWSLLPPKSTE